MGRDRMRKGAPVALALALMSAGCGGGGESGNDIAAPGAEAAAPPTGEASADQVARQQRGQVSCPPKVATPRPAGAPVDDVTGVRPGMTWDEATNAVLCDNPMLVVSENKERRFGLNGDGSAIRHGFDAKFAEARVEKSGADYLREMQEESNRRSANAIEVPLQPGQVRYYVGTMGVAGQERVVTVAREEYFPDGKLPAVEGVAKALIAKYGVPTSSVDDRGGRRLAWKYDPTGRLITETSPLYDRCHVSPSPDASTNLSPDCGVTVSSEIKFSRDNPGLAHSLAVASQHGAEGYARITATDQGLIQADRARRAKEVQDAQKGAVQPKL